MYKIQWSCNTTLIKSLDHLLRKWLRTRELFFLQFTIPISSIKSHLIQEFVHYECSLQLLNMCEEINRANCSSSVGYGWLCGCQSIFPVVNHKQRRNFWTGEPVFPLTRKSERSVARQALDSRSNRVGTLGVTPGATSRDESTHWSPVISSESVRVKGDGGKGSSTNSDGMKKVEPSATSVLRWTDPRAVGSVAFVRFDVTYRLETGNFAEAFFFHVMLKFIYLNIGMVSKADPNIIHVFTFKNGSVFTTLLRCLTIIRIQRNWQRNRPSYWLHGRKKGRF